MVFKSCEINGCFVGDGKKHRPLRVYLKLQQIPSLPLTREVDFAKQKTEGETLFAKKQIVFLSPSRDNATTAPSSEGAIMFFRRGVCVILRDDEGHRPLQVSLKIKALW